MHGSKVRNPPIEAENGIATLDLEIRKLILKLRVEIIFHFACQPDTISSGL